MPEKISQYIADNTSNPIQPFDLLDFSNYDSPGVYDVSKKITVLEFLTYLAGNINTYYTGNGSLNGNRDINANGFYTRWQNGNLLLQETGLINDRFFTVQNSLSQERARLGFKQSANSGEFSLTDSTGEFFKVGGAGQSYISRAFTVGDTTQALNTQFSVRGLNDNSTQYSARFGGLNGDYDSLVIRNDKRVGIGLTTPTAKLDILGEGTGSGVGLRVKDSLGVKNLSIFDNGKIVLGRDNGGTYDFGINLKSFDSINLMAIEEQGGGNYYTFSAGSMYIRSIANIAAIKMGGLLSTDSIEARGVYTGVHDFEIYNPVASTRIARFRTASNVNGTTAGGIVHLDMANNGGVKIGGNATYDPLNKLDIRNASDQRALIVEEARITSVWGDGIAKAQNPFRVKRSNGTLMGYIGTEANGDGFVAIADVGGADSIRLRALGDSYFGPGTTLAIGNNSIDSTAALEVDSTTKGFLPPRLTTAQRTAIVSPTRGLMVYDSDINKLYVSTASGWEQITSV